MYRVYWIENHHAVKDLCDTKEERDLLIRDLEKRGIECGWEKK